jgi:hypothetical protein
MFQLESLWLLALLFLFRSFWVFSLPTFSLIFSEAFWMFSSDVRWRVSCFFLFCFLTLRTDCTEDRVISANGDNWMKMVKWHRSYRRSRIVLVLTVNEDRAMKEAPPVDDDGLSSKVCDFCNLYKLNNITAVRKNTRALKSLHSIFTTCCFVLCSYERVPKSDSVNHARGWLWMCSVAFWRWSA